jgi:hypothetical protein
MTNYTYKPAGVGIGRIEVFEPKPNIVFQMGHANTEVMRLTKEGVWVNPDLKPDDVAQAVLNALDAQIQHMVKKAVEEEREACAKVCEDNFSDGALNIADAIRARSKNI